VLKKDELFDPIQFFQPGHSESESLGKKFSFGCQHKFQFRDDETIQSYTKSEKQKGRIETMIFPHPQFIQIVG
jgi:hypothetical protein